MKSATAPYLEDTGESEELAEATPAEVENLLKASVEAPDHETAIQYAQRAADALPDDPQMQENVQHSVFTRLNQDAFVSFLTETHKHYVITLRNSRPVVVPKARTQPEVFPSPKQTQGERAQGMLWWLVLGLVPAGIGAVILSPFMLGHAIDILWRKDTDGTRSSTRLQGVHREKRLAWVTFFLAGMLGFLGMFFTFLLVLHLIG